MVQRIPGVAASSPLAFGKVPSAGDFLHVRGAQDSELTHWLQQGVEQSHGRLGNAWDAVLDAGSSYGFIYRQATGTTLAGMLIPSRDSVGRRFPLSVFVPLRTTDVGRVAHLLPQLLRPFLLQVQALLDSVHGPSDVAQLVPTITSWALESGNTESAAHDYATWVNTVPLAALWASAFSTTDAEPARGALTTIFQAFGGFRGQEQPATPLAVRVPVGQDRGHVITLWLDLIRRIGGWQTTIPTCFWPVTTTPSSVSVQLGTSHFASFHELWCPGTDLEHMIDLTQGASVASQSGLPDAVSRVLSNPLATAFELLQSIPHA